MMKTLRTYSLMLFFFFLFSKRSKGARRGTNRRALNSSWPSTEKCCKKTRHLIVICTALTQATFKSLCKHRRKVSAVSKKKKISAVRQTLVRKTSILQYSTEVLFHCYLASGMLQKTSSTPSCIVSFSEGCAFLQHLQPVTCKKASSNSLAHTFDCQQCWELHYKPSELLNLYLRPTFSICN